MHPEIIKDDPGECDICGMDLVSAESLGYVPAENDSAPLVIPASAPLITGRRAVVYVDLGEGRFEGREISLGARAGDYYLVESGLSVGERVVTKGNFKIDSAVQILAKPSMMNPSETLSDSGSGVSFEVSEEFQYQVGDLVQAYALIKDDLSHDRYEAGHANVGTVRQKLKAIDQSLIDGEALETWLQRRSELQRAVDAFDGSSDIDSARVAFEAISNTLVGVVRDYSVRADHPVFLYHCPMAFEGRGGDWLQVREGTENPYYGSKMFSCGRLEETLVAHGGHETDAGHEGHGHD